MQRAAANAAPARPPIPPAIAWGLLLAAALMALGALIWLASSRVPYPFELEWMEGAMVDHVDRVRSGQAIYVAPTVDHVAYLYTPLFYYLSALAAAVVGDGFPPLRLVSLLATLACALQVFLLVRRESRDTHHGALAGAVGAGLFLAGYGLVDTWYDLARNDTLFLALLLWCVRLLRWGDTRHLVAAGAVFCLAFLGKQTALMLLPPLLVATAALGWRQLLVFGATAGGLVGVTVLGYHLATDGWFTYFVFEMPRAHSIQGKYKLGFWTEDILPLLPAIVLGFGYLTALWRSGRIRIALFHAAVAGGLLLASYVSRLHAGGHINVLMYALLGGASLCALALTAAPAGRMFGLAALLCLLQFGLLAPSFDPGVRPTQEHRTASEAFVAFLGTAEGDVLVPFHGHLGVLAGKPPQAHMQAMADALFGGDPEVTELLARDVAEALRTRRFAFVVLDHPHAPQFLEYFKAALSGYRPREGPWLESPEAMHPAVGMYTYPVLVLEPTP